MASPDWTKVFVTGYTTELSTGFDYSTLAYDALTGRQLWATRWDGPQDSLDEAVAIAASPDGSKVFVTADTLGPVNYFYGTVPFQA